MSDKELIKSAIEKAINKYGFIDEYSKTFYKCYTEVLFALKENGEEIENLFGYVYAISKNIIKEDFYKKSLSDNEFNICK